VTQPQPFPRRPATRALAGDLTESQEIPQES
jgi:hypothetical protein